VPLNTRKLCCLSAQRCKRIFTRLVCDSNDFWACRTQCRAAFHGQAVCSAFSCLCKLRLLNVVQDVPTLEACMMYFLQHYVGQAVFVHLAHMHLSSLCKLTVEVQPGSNAKRADVPTMPGYIATKCSKRLDLLGAPTFSQAKSIAHTCPHILETLCLHLQYNTSSLYINYAIAYSISKAHWLSTAFVE
jgi:hypothetical protein